MDVGAGADGGVHIVLQRPEAAHRPLHSGGHLQVRFRPMRALLGNRTGGSSEGGKIVKVVPKVLYAMERVLGVISGVVVPTV